MNSVPQHLLNEDRQEYERILDEALRSAPQRPEPAAVGQRLNPEQLRTMALNATALITVAAAAEYQHYVKVRDELRHPAPSTPSSFHESGSAELCTTPMGPARLRGRRVGSGVDAQRWARMPYGRRLLAAVIGLHVRPELPAATAAAAEAHTRNRGQINWVAAHQRELSKDVDRARDAWRQALLERGILPFLRAMGDPGTATLRRTAPPTPTGRIPHLGYNRPDFSSPDDGTRGPRPSFTSPDHTSPDSGRHEH